eukprot:1158380-Pelagomonas_calceolata.AAC.6
MEIERIKALEQYEAREQQRNEERRRGAKVLEDQIAQREYERLRQEELRDQERIQMLREAERLKEEELQQSLGTNKESEDKSNDKSHYLRSLLLDPSSPSPPRVQQDHVPRFFKPSVQMKCLCAPFPKGEHGAIEKKMQAQALLAEVAAANAEQIKRKELLKDISMPFRNFKCMSGTCTGLHLSHKLHCF